MEHPAYEAVFFDLDGTLLPMDLDPFLKGYFGALAKSADAWGYDPVRLNKAVERSVSAMCHHEPGILNSDVFWNRFGECMGEVTQRERDFFDEFYAKDFAAIGEGVAPDPAAARAVGALKAKGYKVYLTTMPLFPREGVEQRLRWAGVDPALFDRITCYDNSTATKPQMEYYEENVQHVGAAPERVLMVGNNTQEDLACTAIGMDAFLVTDHILNPNEFDLDLVDHGSLAEFADIAEAMPVCTVWEKE